MLKHYFSIAYIWTFYVYGWIAKVHIMLCEAFLTSVERFLWWVWYIFT